MGRRQRRWAASHGGDPVTGAHEEPRWSSYTHHLRRFSEGLPESRQADGPLLHLGGRPVVHAVLLGTVAALVFAGVLWLVFGLVAEFLR